MAPAREILIVDDEVGIRELLSEILQDEGYRVALAENAGEARAYRQRQQPALVLLDIWMPDTDGVTLLREWGAAGLVTMPVIMMSGHGTIETAVEATRIGAFDFLEKPIGLSKLLTTISRAFKTAAAKEPRRISLAALGTGAAIRETERALEALASTRKSILILGEPGTGHDVAARSLQTADAPFVAVQNGARFQNNPLSLIEEAHEGIIYCAEIGQYGKTEQKGLSFLLGKLDKHNVTIVATSVEPLGNLATEGKFDAALLAQLSAGAIMLPPLRERRDDIPPLIERYWRESKNGERAAPLLASLNPAALTALTNGHRLRRHRDEPALHVAHGVHRHACASAHARERPRHPLCTLLVADDRRDAQIRITDHARRQPRRGRHPRVDRARRARAREQSAPPVVARRLRHFRRGDVLRRRHDHARDYGAR